MKNDKSTKKRSTLARLMDLMGSKRLLIPLSGALAFLANTCAMLTLVAIWMIFRNLFGDEDAKALGDISTLAWWAFALSVAYLLLYFASLMSAHVAAFRVERNLRYSSMQKAMGMPLGFYEKGSTGKLKKVIDDNAGLVHTFTAHNVPDLFGTTTLVILLFVALPLVDWRMGIASLIPILIAFIAMGSMMSNTNYKNAMGQYMKHLEDMNSEAVEYIRGIPVVKTFQQSVFSFNRFHKSITEYSKWANEYTASCRTTMIIFTIACHSFAFILIPLAIILIYHSEPMKEVFPNMIFYLLITPFFGQGLMKMMYVIDGYRKAGQAVDSVEKLFLVSKAMDGSQTFRGENFDIEFNGVSFRYTDDAPLALKGVSITVPEGKRYALVGSSGSGKTTIARLVARFWDPTEGEVRIGGSKLSDVKPHEVLKHVSFVFQNERLFKTTLRENITYGRHDATEEQIIKAIKMAQCEDIIEKLPDGLETKIGAEGIYLSGGEQQRIALARAFLKDSPILLLDEATAFADPENEHAIQGILKTLMQGRTVLMIAHRLSSVVDVDQIIVMHEGVIKEQGTHEELLAVGGSYSRMWQEYQQSINWTV